MPLKVIPGRDLKLNRLIKSATPVEYRKGKTIHRRGDQADAVLVVQTGHVRLMLPRTGGGSERTVAIVGPGELFGEEAIANSRSGAAIASPDGPPSTGSFARRHMVLPDSALTHTPRRYTAVAGSACAVLSLSGAGVVKALRGSPATFTTLLASYDRDLAIARRIAGSSGSSSRARIADVLLDLAYRLGNDDGRRIRLEHWFTHQELAELAGVHRSTVTTALNSWIYEGVLVQRPRALIVAKRGALRKVGTEASRKRAPKT